jgi:MFS family permease
MAGSVVAAQAPNMLVLIGGRTMQGIGGGGLFALSQIIIGDIFPPRERGRYMPLIAGMWATASIAGPLLGGALAEISWQLIFWLNLPVGAVAIVLVRNPLRLLQVPLRPHALDVLGATLLVLATSALLLVLTWGGSVYRWTSSEILGLTFTSLLLFLGLAIRLKRAQEPLIPLSVLFNPIALAGSSALFIIAGCYVGTIIYLPVHAQSYLGLSPAQAGYSLLGFFIGAVIGSIISGRLTLRITYVNRICVVGAAATAVGYLLLAWTASSGSILLLEVLITIVGTGLGATFPVTLASVQNGVDRIHLGTATGLLSMMRSLGAALGVAAFGAILVGHGGSLGAEHESYAIAELSSSRAFSILYLAAAVMMLVATLIYLTMPHKALRGDERTLAEIALE